MFQDGLRQSAMVYMSSNVLIMLEASYIDRFWPQFECFLSFQVATVRGLDPGSKFDARYCRHHFLSASESTRDKVEEWISTLTERWALRNVTDAVHLFADPDNCVTNGKDKVVQLAKLLELQDLVASLVQKLHEQCTGIDL